jgi:hypothetical protein
MTKENPARLENLRRKSEFTRLVADLEAMYSAIKIQRV